MRAIGKNIVIDLIEEEIKTDSGLLLSSEDSKNLRYGKATVVSAGSEVRGIKEKDIIYYEQRTIIGERSVVVVL